MSRALTAFTLAAAATLLASAAQAQTMEEKWQFQAVVYAYLPSIGGSTSFPQSSSGGGSINVNFDTILDNLNFAFMGTLEARKGRWGLFTDLLYLDVSGSNSGTRDFRIGGRDVPGAVSANLDLSLKGLLWTVAGEYVAVADPSMVVDVLAGARLFDLKQNMSYGLSADVGPFAGPGRSGSSEVNPSYWDAVVGVKGRYMFGDNKQWFVPYYADVGTGESQLTWQVFGGLGYTFSWGSLFAGWRYLDYDFKSSSKIESIDFNGAMLGAAFKW